MLIFCDIILERLLHILFQAGILMGEINLIWPEIRKQIDDPFLVSV